MLSKVCFCILIFFQGAWSFAIDSTSMTKREFSRNTKSADIENNLHSNVDESLSKAMGNLERGFTSFSVPVVNYGFNTYPNIFSSSLQTANGATSEVTKAKDGKSYVLAGRDSAVNGGEELASSIIGGEKKVIGSGLGVFGQLFDVTPLKNSVTTDMTNGMLMGIGDGNVIANSESNMINIVGNAIIQNIINAKRIFASIIKLILYKLKFGLMYLNSGFQTNYNNVLDLFKNFGITKPEENNDDSLSVTDEVTTVPLVTTTEGSADPALLAAADITSDLAALDTNPSGSNNPELEDSASNAESSAGSNPEDTNDTASSDALAGTNPEETDPALSDDVTTESSATTTEGSANPALLAAADLTSALAALDTNPLGSNNPELEDSASNDDSSGANNFDDNNDTTPPDALAETIPEKPNHPASSDDSTTEAEATTEGSANPALLAAADITSALAALDTNPSESNNPELEDSASSVASSSGTNPEDTNDTVPSNDESLTADLAGTKPEETNHPASSDDATTEPAATTTEGSADPALLAAADITSALAALDTNPSETNNSELEDSASGIPLAGTTQEDKNDAEPSTGESSSSVLTETKPDETSDPILLSDDIITEPSATTESALNPALLGAADITSALAALDTNPPESDTPESEDSVLNDATLSEANPEETNNAESTVTDGFTSVLTGTAPERPVHPALLAAASFTSALAETDPSYSSS